MKTFITTVILLSAVCVLAHEPEGKRRTPGTVFAPLSKTVTINKPKAKFEVPRDPFRPPTEVLPIDCAPSNPLCRFDPSQLKLTGIIKFGVGRWKATIEDPDGRGFFLMVGDSIGGGRYSVVFIGQQGIMFMDSKHRFKSLSLYKETKESNPL